MFMHEPLSSPQWSLGWHEVVLDRLTDSDSDIENKLLWRREMVISEVICSAGDCLSQLTVKARRRQVKPERRGVMEFRKWCKANRRECARQFVRRGEEKRGEEVLIEMSDSQHWLGNIFVVGGMQWSDISSVDHPPPHTLSPWGPEISGKSARSHSQLTFLTK